LGSERPQIARFEVETPQGAKGSKSDRIKPERVLFERNAPKAK